MKNIRKMYENIPPTDFVKESLQILSKIEAAGEGNLVRFNDDGTFHLWVIRILEGGNQIIEEYGAELPVTDYEPLLQEVKCMDVTDTFSTENICHIEITDALYLCEKRADVMYFALDLNFDEPPCTVRPLTKADTAQVQSLDTISGNDVKGWLEDNTDYVWGMFLDEALIGYCTIGLADVLEFELGGYEHYSPDALLLSDVFILPKYRHNGYAVRMINEAIKQRNQNVKKPVFLTLMDMELSKVYGCCGFERISNYFMMKC